MTKHFKSQIIYVRLRKFPHKNAYLFDLVFFLLGFVSYDFQIDFHHAALGKFDLFPLDAPLFVTIAMPLVLSLRTFSGSLVLE